MPKSVTFISQHANHKLCMKTIKQKLDAYGQLVVTDTGKDIAFSSGEYTTDNPKEIEFIRNHSAFGTEIHEEQPIGKDTEKEIKKLNKSAK